MICKCCIIVVYNKVHTYICLYTSFATTLHHRTWARSTASLVIIMGIAWLIGLFTFHAVVYYIATLFYALQVCVCVCVCVCVRVCAYVCVRVHVCTVHLINLHH